MSGAPETDHPHAVVLPPKLYGGALVAGLVLQFLLPLDVGFSETARWIAALPILGGAALILTAFRLFRLRGTNVPPVKPALVFVVEGPYRFTRNPMYLGMTAIFLGLAVALDNGWLLILALPVLAVMRFGVIAREEAYLERRFGTAYLDFKARVRRWL